MILRVFDPTNEVKTAGGQPAERSTSLRCKTVGFITNGNLTHLEYTLREDLRVADVIWRKKSNYSAPADAHIVDEIKT
jgi:hypothetical protein